MDSGNCNTFSRNRYMDETPSIMLRIDLMMWHRQLWSRQFHPASLVYILSVRMQHKLCWYQFFFLTSPRELHHSTYWHTFLRIIHSWTKKELWGHDRCDFIAYCANYRVSDYLYKSFYFFGQTDYNSEDLCKTSLGEPCVCNDICRKF